VDRSCLRSFYARCRCAKKPRRKKATPKLLLTTKKFLLAGRACLYQFFSASKKEDARRPERGTRRSRGKKGREQGSRSKVETSELAGRSSPRFCQHLREGIDVATCRRRGTQSAGEQNPRAQAGARAQKTKGKEVPVPAYAGEVGVSEGFGSRSTRPLNSVKRATGRAAPTLAGAKNSTLMRCREGLKVLLGTAVDVFRKGKYKTAGRKAGAGKRRKEKIRPKRRKKSLRRQRTVPRDRKSWRRTGQQWQSTKGGRKKKRRCRRVSNWKGNDRLHLNKLVKHLFCSEKSGQ